MPFNSPYTADTFIGAVKQAIIDHELGIGLPYDLRKQENDGDKPVCSMGHGYTALGVNRDSAYDELWNIPLRDRHNDLDRPEELSGLTMLERSRIETSNDGLFDKQDVTNAICTTDPVRLTEHLRLLEKIPVEVS